MLDTGLSWEIAKQQCGEGTEVSHEIQPDSDAALYVGLWNAYRAKLPYLHNNANVLIPFIDGGDLDPNMQELDILTEDGETKFDSNLLDIRLESLFLRHTSTFSLLTDELLRNALDVSIRTQKPITVQSYVGVDGGAYAAEQKDRSITLENMLQAKRRGNRGKGIPQFRENKTERFGIEQIESLCRTMIVSTIADRRTLLLPHATIDENKSITIDSTSIWGEYVTAQIENLRAACTMQYMRHPTHEKERTLPPKEVMGQKLIEKYRSLAWERVREMYSSGKMDASADV